MIEKPIGNVYQWKTYQIQYKAALQSNGNTIVAIGWAAWPGATTPEPTSDLVTVATPLDREVKAPSVNDAEELFITLSGPAGGTLTVLQGKKTLAVQSFDGIDTMFTLTLLQGA